MKAKLLTANRDGSIRVGDPVEEGAARKSFAEACRNRQVIGAMLLIATSDAYVPEWEVDAKFTRAMA
jgi:hypothetical protein